MLRRQFTHALFLVLATMTLSSGRIAYGVDPQPLQNAYWRFEEGIANGYVPAPAPGDEGPGEIKDSVLDSSGNENHMQAFNSDTAPKYVNYSLPPAALASGLPNSLAWEVDGGPGGGRDTYTNTKNIHNGIIGGAYDHDNDDVTAPIPSTTTGFTLEAAFSVFDYSSFRGIVAKEGRPGLAMGSDDANLNSLPTMALKVRGPQSEGDPDQGKLQIELFDGAGNLVSVASDEALAVGEWYYAAVVNDGETLSLYLNDGDGYVLEGTAAVDGALFQGLNYNDASWDKNWTVGRAVYGGIENGSPSDWFNGLIDEVRVTNEALDPSEFLFASTGLDGDFNDDDVVDGQDFLLWQRGQSPNPNSPGDLADWKQNFGAVAPPVSAVPEPAAATLAVIAVAAGLRFRRRR